MHVREIAWLEPPEAAARCRPLGGLVLLDSALPHPELGRHSYVAADPFGRFTAADGVARWNAEVLDGPPLEALSRLLTRFALPDQPGLPPFQSGAAGFLAYELGRSLERLPEPLPPPHGRVPDMSLGFHDVVIAFDHVLRRAWIVSSGLPEADGPDRQRRARHRAELFARRLATPAESGTAPPIPRDAWASSFTREAYLAAVASVVEAILDGEIFQANIAQRFTADLPPGFDAWAFYRRLRAANPAPFAAFLEQDGIAIASSSPERFLQAAGDAVETRPIKGTAPRAADAEADARRAAALLASEKDRAENLMIVDLLRNDLARVSRLHSVETPTLCGLESYAGVHHLVSVVRSRLAPGRTLPDLLAAAFPGGSITGAPKPRAMEIITAIEREARGVYCGAIGFLGFNGRLDTSIAIRTVLFQNGRAVFQAGGGITALSDPAAEHAETLIKAERIFRAFEAA